MTGRHRRNRVLAAIAVLKYVKALLLVAGGLGALRLLHPEVAAHADAAAAAVSSTFVRTQLEHLLARVAGLSPGHLTAIGIGAFVYAALFIVEGTGLWLEQRWAEILTVIATASLIPFESWELAHRITIMRSAAFVLNIVIVIYLIQQLRRPAAAG